MLYNIRETPATAAKQIKWSNSEAGAGIPGEDPEVFVEFAVVRSVIPSAPREEVVVTPVEESFFSSSKGYIDPSWRNGKDDVTLRSGHTSFITAITSACVALFPWNSPVLITDSSSDCMKHVASLQKVRFLSTASSFDRCEKRDASMEGHTATSASNSVSVQYSVEFLPPQTY